mmetsp:Transcript_17690/g.32716  ORF Transcript_17690/g.32716 Transcript_17690/m.32716 type:complete len:416 (-) Transcript_17690:423-1670(-)
MTSVSRNLPTAFAPSRTQTSPLAKHGIPKYFRSNVSPFNYEGSKNLFRGRISSLRSVPSDDDNLIEGGHSIQISHDTGEFQKHSNTSIEKKETERRNDIDEDSLDQFSSILLLNFVAVIWGSQHAFIKTIVQDSDVASFTFLRFFLASIIASPYLPGLPFPQRVSKTEATNNDDLLKAWRWGAEMGLWMFLGFSLQAVGLLSTTAQRSGFLLYLNVKLVPFFAYVLLGRNITTLTWISSLAAFSGTALLALDGKSIGLNAGDFWSVLAAAASAMFILRLEKATIQVPKSAELNATSLFVVAVLSGLWILAQDNFSPASLSPTFSELKQIAWLHPFELLYLGAISTALSNFIQAKAQKHVPAERASIIYSLDPVYGALFSFLLLGETLGGVQAYIGASMIFIAAATNSLIEFSKEE